MRVSEESLKSQLAEYRKAYRAMMRFYDSSLSLFNLFDTELNVLFESVEEILIFDEINENWEKPSGVSLDAFKDVTASVNNWILSCCSQEDLKPRKSSIYLSIHLSIDIWPTKINPAESISAISVYGYRINNVNGNVTDSWSDLEDNFNNHMIDESNDIDEDGEPKSPMPIKIFPNVWSSKNDKYQGDYAVGMYDLSTLIDEDTVKKIIISDIKKLIKEWSL